jgi:ABC-type antimicrobial peptide transport system permease subunit
VSDTEAKLAPNEVWLADTSTAPPNGLPSGAVVTFRSQVQQQLRTAPLAEEPLRALLAVALATTLLALCGLIVSVLSSGAERAAEFALLDALGFSRRGKIGTLCLEQALLAGPGALAGIALGLLLGRVVIPVATLTAGATKPQPPVTVLTPWPQVLIGVAGLLAVPLVTFAVAGVRRRDTAAVLREEAGR